jgi:hypothetical protein
MLIARAKVTSEENVGSTDSNCVHILAIDAFEALGYRGAAREEHSGENKPVDPPDLESELADNRSAQVELATV